jgi:predicted secreted acid phosphatase
MKDIDETILNSSPYQSHQLLPGKNYDPVIWKEWTAKGEADIFPGALDFPTYTSAAGIEVF